MENWGRKEYPKLRLGVHEAGCYLGRTLIKRALSCENFSKITAVCHKSNKNSTASHFDCHPNFELLYLDMFDKEDMKNVFKKSDIVVSCLGGRRSTSMLPTRTTLYSEATRVLLHSLLNSRREIERETQMASSLDANLLCNDQQLHQFRLIFISSWGTKSLLDKWDQAREPKVEVHFKQCVVSPVEFKNSVADLDKAETLLLESPNSFKGLTTIVRAPEIVNEKSLCSNALASKNGRYRMHYEESKSYVLNSYERISADDLSKFILKCVNEKLCTGKVIAVGLVN